MPKKTFFHKILHGKSPLLIILILVVLVITVIDKPGSLTAGNAQAIMAQLCYFCIFGVGVGMLLMGGGFDFATSAHATMSTLIFLKFMQWFPQLPWPIYILAALCFGAFAGGFNAYLAHGLGLMPFIATIGMKSVWGGLASWATRGNYVSINIPAFSKFSSARIGDTPIPWLFIGVIAIVIIYGVILKWTRFGRSVLMVGGNAYASRLAGLNPNKVKSLLYVNNGVLAAVGGLIWSSQQKMYNPAGLTTLMPEMTALTAAILGGVSFMGGSGSLGGAFFGIMLITTLSYSLQVMALPLWFVTITSLNPASFNSASASRTPG